MKNLLFLTFIFIIGCARPVDSDETQRNQQEKILSEATSQVGMPAVKNFTERKLLKQIIELRDQADLITYTYLENQIPKTVAGVTSLGGKITFLGQSIGFGIPYSTQFTNPQKPDGNSYGWFVLPQADPNGLFSPSSAIGTWVIMYDKEKQKALPQYIESNILVFTYKLSTD